MKLYDVYEDMHHYVLVMEYLRGRDLLHKILEYGELEEHHARTCIFNLIKAISHCHEKNILHRDICLENIVIADPERGFESLKLIDFGAACKFRDNKKVREKMGNPIFTTLEYSAPEVLEDQYYGVESDYWSIGVVAYVLLSGVMPFYADDKSEL